MSDKIKPHHLGRKAILYVRQSSPHHVLHNRESRALQYAMRDLLAALGWSEIETVDNDLGRSAVQGGSFLDLLRFAGLVEILEVGEQNEAQSALLVVKIIRRIRWRCRIPML